MPGGTATMNRSTPEDAVNGRTRNRSSSCGLPERGTVADSSVKRWLNAPVPAWAAVLLAGVSVAAALSRYGLLPRTRVPDSWEFEGREVVAYSSNGRRLWSHPFGRVVSSPDTL